MSEKKKINIKNVRIVRLMSGEELICEYSSKGDTHTLTLPCLIVPTGQNNIGLAPWMPYADYDNTITLEEKVVAWVIKAHSELASEYERIHSDAPQLIVPTKEVREVAGVIGAS
jgi:hypothetical protein